MPNDTVRDFLYGIGFGVNTASQAQAEAAVKKVEATATAAAQKGAAERAEIDAKAADERVSLAAALGRLLSLEEEKLADAREKARKAESEKDEKRKEDAAKRERERSDEAFKRSQQQFYRMASLAVKTAAFFEIGKALDKITFGFMSKIDAAAEGFERLAYASQRVGASAGSISAFGYASAQTGSNAQAAQASLEGFGQRLRINRQGYGQALRRLGIQTTDRTGRARDTGDIAADLGERLSSISKQGQFGYANALNQARVFGFEDENQVRAMMDPAFRQRYQEQKALTAAAGADQGRASRSGQAFEQSMRRLTEIVSAVGTRINEVFFERLKPRLDDLANWIAAHGKAIGDITAKIVEGIAKVAEAFLKSDVVQSAINGLSKGLDEFAGYVASPQFKKDIKGFVADVMALARAVRNALEWIGVIPSKSSDPIVPAPQGTASTSDDLAGFGASLRNRRGGRGHQDTDFNAIQGKLGAFRATSAQQRANAFAISDELRKAGLPDEGIAASLGSAQTESGLNPAVPENSYNHGHHGLWQWDSTRWPKIAAWIRNQGGDPMDARWQTRAHIAEGRAKPGDPIYDSPQTTEGFHKLETSKGDLGRAVEGMRGIERFGRGEEGGRAANAGQWLGHMPTDPNVAVGSKGDYPDWMDDRSRRELAAVNAPLARDLLAAAKETGIQFRVAQGLRTQEEANANAMSGRGVRNSQHLYGAAADIHLLDANGNVSYDRALYQRFADAYTAHSSKTGGQGRWLGSLGGRWGADIVHFDQGLGYGQSHARDPYGQGGPTKEDIVANNRSIYASPQNPFLRAAPVKVDVTETSAFRLGKAFVSSSPLLQTPRGSGSNTLSNIHAQWQRYADEHGLQVSHPGKPAREPLGLSPHQVMQIDQSKTRGDLHLTRSDTYHLHGGDGRVMVAEARRSAGRGDADLLRNLQTMES